MLEKRIRSILSTALQTMGQSAAFPLPRVRSLELRYILEKMLDWKPLGSYKHQLLSKIRPYLLDLLKYASNDWIWTQEVYRCLKMMS